MLFDKIYKESYSREELIEVYRQTVPRLNKRKGNTGKRYCYITNGVEIKKADPDLPIPEGWWRGCPRKKERGIANE